MHIDSLVYKRLGKAPIWMGLTYNCMFPHHASGRARPTGMGENGFTVMLTICYICTWDTALITQAMVSHQSEKTETCPSTQATLVSGLVQFRFLLSHISPLGKPAPEIYDQDCKKDKVWRIAILWLVLFSAGPLFSFTFVLKWIILWLVKLWMNIAISTKQLQD